MASIKKTKNTKDFQKTLPCHLRIRYCDRLDRTAAGPFSLRPLCLCRTSSSCSSITWPPSASSASPTSTTWRGSAASSCASTTPPTSCSRSVGRRARVKLHESFQRLDWKARGEAAAKYREPSLCLWRLWRRRLRLSSEPS